jgi:DNA processing protein
MLDPALDPALEPWLRALHTPRVGAATVEDWLERHGSLARALMVETRGKACDEAALAASLKWLEHPQHWALALDDPRYPSRLRQTPGAPLVLFGLGDMALLDQPQIAMVGSRLATPQGVENAHAFAKAFAQVGLVVTSGLAYGIDAAAHKGALEAGQTLAVCGTGLDRVYPARHKALAHQIVEKGVLLSEFPPGVEARPEHFPRRNRIISALSLGVLVVEAAKDSGSLITAKYANEQGREVFAIPGSIHNPQAKGCHWLLRQGAKLVESAQDVLEELAPQLRRYLQSQQAVAVDEDPALTALGFDPVTLDTLAARLNKPMHELQSDLLVWELEGKVAVLSDGRVQRHQS